MSGQEQGQGLLAGLSDVNLVDHPLKQRMAEALSGEYQAFDHRYFDDPASPTGFGGYTDQGNQAEGARDFAAEAAVLAALPGVHTALDVGCAKGFLVAALRRRGVEAWGRDISQYAVEAASPDVRPYLSVGPAQDLPADRTYDLVHCHGVMIYLELPVLRATLARMRAVALRYAVFYEPTRESLEAAMDQGDPGALDPLRRQELPAAVWAALREEAGFVPAPELGGRVWRVRD